MSTDWTIIKPPVSTTFQDWAVKFDFISDWSVFHLFIDLLLCFLLETYLYGVTN